MLREKLEKNEDVKLVCNMIRGFGAQARLKGGD